MRLKYILLAVLMVNILAVSSTYAQIKVTNEDGDKIVLLPDGTWKYADDNKQATASSEVKAKQKAGKAKVDSKKLTKAEKKKLKEIEKNKKRSEEIRKKLAKQRSLEKKKEEDRLKKEGEKAAKLARKGDESQKNTKKAPSKKKDSKVATNKKKKDTSKKKNTKVAENKKSKTSKKSNNKTSKKEAKLLADKADSGSGAKKPTKKLQSKLVRQQFKPFKTLDVVKPEPECAYSMNEIDLFTKQKKVAVEPAFFFGYTHPKLEEFLRGDNYLTCNAHLSEIGSLLAFNLKFIIDSPTAQDDYGQILEGSRLLINLLDGSTITLVSSQEDGGRIDRGKQQTIYSTYFIIDNRSEKKLRKSEISEVRMVWSKGYENYDVYEVDFIINQLNCLDNADN